MRREFFDRAEVTKAIRARFRKQLRTLPDAADTMALAPAQRVSVRKKLSAEVESVILELIDTFEV